MHEGHRERLREKFRKNGVEGLADHEMLELLLFNSVPRANTNPIAHALIERFGSLSGVLEADERQLTEVEGVGPRSAHLIRLISAFSRLYLSQKNDVGEILDTSEKLGKFMAPYYIGAVNEIFYCITLDNRYKLINCTKLSEGAPDMVNINIRRIIEIAIKDNAASLVITHNHPKGFALPSKDDFNTTVQIITTMNNIGIRVLDHIIVGADGDFVSLASSKNYKHFFRK